MTQPTDPRRDDGFTLVELVIAAMLLVLVLSVVGAIMSSLSQTSKTVNSMTSTSTSAQLAAESIERGIRNSSDFLLTNPTGTDQMLVARTAQGNTTLTWTCVAWYYSSANGGSIRYTMSPSAIATPTAATLSQWTLLATGVAPSSGTGIFSGSSPQLTIGFNGQSTGAGNVTISSTVVSRAGSSGTPACY
ncbi:prepilin-type N-terminal cleavage/methylation domain-containing protein [Leifsonia sp. P73]|uniref:prepilin-type N-terminal cleavage/methylation domain-containing protein n=1 Tax=Leifsonia sp. P73 TaxID=3423959 RepID=UPI003DA65B38